MERPCARPTCTNTAAATMTFSYNEQTVWLGVLAAEANPMDHDLCLMHADRTTAPVGWVLDDRRTAFKLPMLPLGISQAS